MPQEGKPNSPTSFFFGLDLIHVSLTIGEDGVRYGEAGPVGVDARSLIIRNEGVVVGAKLFTLHRV